MEEVLLQLMSDRRSCRKYLPKPVPDHLLIQVLEAGRMAPSGSNVQLCHFVVVRGAEKLEAVRSCVERELATLDLQQLDHPSSAAAVNAAKKGEYRFFYDAPVLIAVANHQDNYNWAADSACAMQNMMLMATELELGNCWINQLRRVNTPSSLAKLLGLAEGERLFAGLALGYAAEPLPQEALPRTKNYVDYLE